MLNTRIALRAFNQSLHRSIELNLNRMRPTLIKTQQPIYHSKSTSSTTESVTDNVKDISKTAKEEANRTIGSVLEAVSGGKQNEVISDLRSVGGLYQSVPREAIIFGGAGLVPYLATSITTIYLARQAYNSENGIGAIHWGIEFASHETKTGPKGTPRYMLGTLPVILAWPTLLLPGQLALASQWAAFTIVWYTDMIATGKGWTPKWYSTYRFGLTALVGGSIIITLSATNYWAVNQVGYSSTSQKLQEIRERESGTIEEKQKGGGTGGMKVKGIVPKGGSMGSVSGEDAFVKIKDVVAAKSSKSSNEKGNNSTKGD
ncbi:hypothetical protein CROQUDRAFT_663888 [Cronartium quercuum f. sp. fusiforme G11]|uniref:Uncharacterized protein n=1 Tax=Cronartium quercuum f. sp. fusiforme G11 TaxID=708437 RepID=A0A9P6NCW6_9BASI|nr:hypothetical protein CROQUDRAFT_663888 [Cronartium quercuum f. sp. fusiforme G11]